MLTPLLAGLLTGLSLIVAIGAQNAFVLRQGISRRHVAPVVAVCALSDLVLIAAGTLGFGALVTAHPLVVTIARVVGVIFLVGYGVLALLRARRPGRLRVSERTASSALAAVAIALGFTWLNPHVYLDTLVMLGSIAVSHGPVGRWWFAAGAGTASIVWFSALGFGARLLQRVFERPAAWRVLDLVIGVTMLALAAGLLFG